MTDAHTLTGAYVCDALEPGERSAVEDHLQACEPCTQEVAEFSGVAAILGAALATDPPDALGDAVRARIVATHQERGASTRLRRLLARFR